MAVFKPATGYSTVSLVDALYDAFSRIRVSQPTTLFDSQQEYGLSPLFWQTSTAGSGTVTHLPDDSASRLRVTNGATDSALTQTRQYFRYQPGKAQLILLTGVFPTGDDLIWTRRKGGVDTSVSQDAWNVDSMNGTGEPVPTWTLDPTKGNIYWIALEWLGVGSVFCGHFFNGKPYVSHEFQNSNALSTTYMRTANLPVRFSLSNSGGTTTVEVGYGDASDGVFLQQQSTTAATNDLTQICCSVISEGGFEEGRGIPFTANSSATGVSVADTELPLLSIRPKAQFNSITNRSQIIPQEIQLMNLTKSVLYRVYYGATLTGSPSWADCNATYSTVEYDRAASGFSGGVCIKSIYVPAAAKGQSSTPGTKTTNLGGRLPLTLDISGGHPTTPLTDSLTVTAISAEGTDAATCYAAINGEELY